MPFLALLTVTSLGVRAADGVSVARTAPQGYVLSGPLCGLAAGDYELAFRCRNSTARVHSQPVFGIEVVALTRGSLVWRDFTTDELAGGIGAIRFRVEPELDVERDDKVRFSFKFFHYSNADITFTSIELRSIARKHPDNVDATRLRLLGRFTALRVAERKDGHVFVSRESRPGCFLAGPNALDLPQCSLRLTVRGGAQRVRLAGQPVLGVEIQTFVDFAGHPRGPFQCICRDFTAEELALGLANFDFVAGESLADTNRFRFEFYHFGNADLDIESIELAEYGHGGGLVAGVLRRWRLTGRLRKLVTAPVVSYFGLPSKLSAITPHLMVVAGRYRLSMELAAPRSLSRSAMKVEILAIDNWRPPDWLEWLFVRLRWRLRATLGAIATHRVSIDEKRAGKIVCDFEVPPELGYDGEHVWIDVRFTGAGIGGVDIRNLEISSVAETEAPSARGIPNLRTSRRPHLMIYGNCQAYALSELLRRSLLGRFSITFQWMDEREAKHKRQEFERADVLFIQDVTDWENNPLRLCVSASATIIKFPNLRLASLWPFDEVNGPGDAEPPKVDWPESFHYRDGLLGRLRKATPDPELRFARYAALEAELVANPARLHQFEARRLATMDRQFECRIGRFIVDNFQHRRLFHTTSHPNGDVLVQLLDLLATRLDTRWVKQSAAIADSYLNWNQVPIHPKIAKMLGVTWADENTLYHFRGEQITWEAYIREYIRYYG